MPIPSIFSDQATADAMTRLGKLSHDSKPLWGKMNAAQMLAHINVAYELTYGERTTSINPIMKFFVRTFFKEQIVGEKKAVYPKNSRTAPDFMISGERDFNKEKERFVAYVNKTAEHGTTYFDGRQNQTFGKLTAKEWSNLFYKHMDHHFRQFGI